MCSQNKLLEESKEIKSRELWNGVNCCLNEHAYFWKKKKKNSTWYLPKLQDWFLQFTPINFTLIISDNENKISRLITLSLFDPVAMFTLIQDWVMVHFNTSW